MRNKVRKSLAFLLALALVVSVMSGLGLSVSAEQESNTPGTEEVQQQDKTEAGAAPSEVKAEEEAAKPEEKPVPEEKKDEQKAEGEGSGAKTAEKQEKATPKAGENVQTATIGTGDKTVTVKTTAAAGVLPEGAKLVVKKLANQDQAYQDAESTLKDSQVTYDDFLALDVGFEVNGKEVEPEAGSVQVQFELGAGLLPETADTSTLAVQHLTDGKAETVADAGAVTAGDVTVKNQVVKADFEVQSFSSFTITWSTQNEDYLDTHFKATVKYVDEDGAEINTGKEANVSVTGNQTLDIKKEYGHDISGYSYLTARYQNAKTGSEITQIKTTETTNGRKVTRTVKLIMSTGGEIIVKSNERPIIYLVYTQNTSGGHTGPTQTLAHEKYVTKNDDHTYDLNLTVSGKKGSKKSKAKVDILLILDRSGSMDDSDWGSATKMQQVASAVQTLTDNLKNNDNIDARYSVVSFAGKASVDQDWTSSAGAAYAAVAKATPNGGTNYQAGIFQGKNQLAKSRQDAQTMVVFLTDGALTYQGTESTSGCGSKTHQDYIDNAKKELKGMTADGFYCVGVELDSKIEVYKGNEHDWFGWCTGSTIDKTGKAILQEIIDGATGITDKPAPMMANNPTELNAAFDKIKAKITDLLCNHVIVTDVLSENVKMVTNSETDTTPKKLVVTIKKNADGSIVQGPKTSVKDGEYEIKAEYDATAKQITLKFDPNYTLKPDYTYIVTATIEATEKAYENVRANKVNTGDAGTGDTSAGKKGVYSNKLGEAKVSYKYNDSDKTEDYNKPVIQPEPAKLIVKKTISGLESLSDEQIKALEEKMTFNITYTYPTGNQNTVTETKKLSDFAKNDDGTYTYTSGDIWSMGATYKVAETGYPVTGYDRAATPTEAKGSIPKYSTATATFTNTYTPSAKDLKIQKEIEGETVAGQNAKFTFTVSGPESASGGYTIQGTEDKATFTNGKAEVTITGANSITIENLPLGTYTVSETSMDNVGGYTWTTTEKAKSGSATLSADANGMVTITNILKKNPTVTIVKKITGNMSDPKDEFKFKVNDGPDQTVTAEEGKNTIETEVPYGSSFTVTESDKGGYTLESVSAKNDQSTTGLGKEISDGWEITSVTENTTITFTNKKQINPPNGIITTIAPYAIMVVLAAGAGVYFVYSRRRRNR